MPTPSSDATAAEAPRRVLSRTGLKLYKAEKLCSEVAIGQLFDRRTPGVSTALAYPLRMVWRLNPQRHGPDCPRFLISIPKKRLRHAVDRVAMRRRVREAYRLNRELIDMTLPLEIVFVYVADELVPSSRIHQAMRRLLGKMHNA